MQTRHSVYLTYLHMLAFALLWLGGILLLNTPQYAGHAPGATAMIPAVGVAALLFGLLLLGTIYRWRRLAFLCGAIISLILLLYVAGGVTTGATLLEILNLQGLRELRLSLVLAILFGTASICLSWGSKRARQAGRWLGVATVLIALLSFLSSFSQPTLLASLTLWASLLDLARFATELEATFNTSLLLLMLGAGCVLLNNNPAHVDPKFDRSTLLAGVIGAGVTCLGWHLMHLHNSETLRTRSEQVLASTQHMLSQERLAQVQLMQRTAQRWELEDRFPTPSMWEHESRSYLRDFPNLGLVGILDDRLEPARTAARAPEDRTWLHGFLLAEEHRDWLGHVLESHEAHMSPGSESGSSMALIAAPLYLSGRGRWLVVASVDVPAMIRRHINLEHTEFILRVEERGRTIFSSSDLPVDSLILVNSTSTEHHDHGNNAWDVGIYIDREGTLLRAAFLPPLLLLFGLGLTWLLMISQRLVWQSRERDQFFRLSLDMFFTLDSAGNFLLINPAFTEAFGQPPEELLGTPYTALVFPSDQARVRAAVERLQQGHQVLNLEIKGLSKSGNIRWLELNATPTEGHIYCAARDITERKRTESQLKVTLDELASSNQELENFAFVASHDLQEPLRKIQAFGERLQTRAGNLDDQSRDYLQRMSSAAQRMQTLILDLLAYSRVSTRKQPFVDLDLNAILAEVLGDLETAFRESHAELVSEALPHIHGDATHIRQVFQNLISNAVKFRQKDLPPRIRVYAEEDSSGTWTLCITDNGIGFDEKYLDRIFDPFQRLHSRQAYPGTGIGLAIVTKIVERHNATITATSTPGTGTTFRITFSQTSPQEEATS